MTAHVSPAGLFGGALSPMQLDPPIPGVSAWHAAINLGGLIVSADGLGPLDAVADAYTGAARLHSRGLEVADTLDVLANREDPTPLCACNGRGLDTCPCQGTPTH